MDSPKVIITKKNVISKQYSLENEVGLSSYDLALISINKIIKKRSSALNVTTKNTYLI